MPVGVPDALVRADTANGPWSRRTLYGGVGGRLPFPGPVLRRLGAANGKAVVVMHRQEFAYRVVARSQR